MPSQPAVTAEARTAYLSRSTWKTVAVLGTGLDTIYPAENKELANKIIKTGGAIISEFIVGSAIKKTNFPNNRHHKNKKSSSKNE